MLCVYLVCVPGVPRCQVRAKRYVLESGVRYIHVRSEATPTAVDSAVQLYVAVKRQTVLMRVRELGSDANANNRMMW